MVTLDYQLIPPIGLQGANVDVAHATLEELRYNLFTGNVYLRGETGDLSAPWEWVPVLDFALSVRAIADALGSSQTERFEFTESDAVLIFHRQGGFVEITASYAPGLLRLPFLEFKEQAKAFCRRVITDLATSNLRLAANPEVRRQMG